MSYKADHLSFRTSKQMLPQVSMLGWQQGMRNFTMGALQGQPLGNSRESLHLRSSYAVPAAPWMVPSHLKMLSDSGKAENPLSPDIMRVITTCCNLVPTGSRAVCPLGSALLPVATTLAESGSWFWEAIQVVLTGTHELKEHDLTLDSQPLSIVPLIHSTFVARLIFLKLSSLFKPKTFLYGSSDFPFPTK